LTSLKEGGTSRAEACLEVAPWIEGSFPIDAALEAVAQTIHGLDIVRGPDGLDRHQSQGGVGHLVISEEEYMRRITSWIIRLEDQLRDPE
jgi:hypothetical protein